MLPGFPWAPGHQVEAGCWGRRQPAFQLLHPLPPTLQPFQPLAASIWHVGCFGTLICNQKFNISSIHVVQLGLQTSHRRRMLMNATTCLVILVKVSGEMKTNLRWNLPTSNHMMRRSTSKLNSISPNTINLQMSYLQNSIAPKWNIYFSFVLKGHLRFTRVSTKPSQIYVRYRAIIISS